MAITNFVKRIQDVMRNDAGVNGDAQRIEQIVWTLFLKIYDAKEEEWELINDDYISIIPDEYKWRNWAVDNKDGQALTGDALLDFVNNKLFPALKNLEVSEDTPMNQMILQMAMQGKLVEQRPEEGTADELYEQIVAEKARLIKDGKIKKEKPVPEITDDEIPFEIPSSWKWVRIGEVISYQNGYAYSSKDMSDLKIGYPVIKSGNLMTLQVVINSKTSYIDKPNDKMLESQIKKSDMLMCLSSQSDNPEPLGKTAVYRYDFPALLNQRVLKITAIKLEMVELLYYFINSHYFHYNVSHQGGGSAQANLKLEHVLNMLIPLPPLKEQKRIVAKIVELLPYCDRLIK